MDQYVRTVYFPECMIYVEFLSVAILLIPFLDTPNEIPIQHPVWCGQFNS